MSGNNIVNKKFSVKLAGKVHQLKKLLKPVIKFIHGHKKVKTIITVVKDQSEDSDFDQNAANEALEARVRDDIFRSTNAQGGGVSLWVDGRLTFVQDQLEYIPIPVKFAYTPAGDFLWAPLADSDICLRGAHSVHTTGQIAEKQVPIHNELQHQSW